MLSSLPPSRSRNSRVSRRALVGAIVVILGCRTGSPLEREFRELVHRYQFENDDALQDWAPVEAFVRDHGEAGAALYEDLLRRFRYATDPEGRVLAEASVFGLSHGPPRVQALPLLHDIAVDPACSLQLRRYVVNALSHITGESVSRLLGERLLREKDLDERRSILSSLIRIADPASAQIIAQAASAEPDEALRHRMQLTVKLLVDPRMCLLDVKRLVPDVGWACQYACTAGGAKVEIFPTGCLEAIPKPQ